MNQQATNLTSATARVIVETESRPFYVRSGEQFRDDRGRVIGFSGLTLTTSPRWAAKFPNAGEVASAINQAIATGFYANLRITFAR